MLRLRFTDESGFALAAVMGAVALITTIALGGYYLAQNTLHESVRVSNENRAYQAASSALDQELSVFKPAFLLTGQSPSGYAYGTQQSINGSDWFVVNVNDSADDASLGPDEYEMVAVGGSQNTSETVRLRFMSFNLWDMNISGGENSGVGSGAGFNGNGHIIGKAYSNGDFEWSGNGSIEGGPIFVRNGVFNKQSSGSNVGSSDDPVATYFDNPPIGQTTNMFTETKGSAPKIQIPWPDQEWMDLRRELAINDAVRNKLGDATPASDSLKHPDADSVVNYNIFNNDLTLGPLAFGQWGPVVKNGDGSINEAVSGDVLAVKAESNGSKTLYINGVVYVDGDVTLDSSIRQYAGKGMIVATGTIHVYGRLVPIAYNSGSYEEYLGEYFPIVTTNDCLGLASLGGVTQHIADWVSAAVFTAGSYVAEPTGAKFRGSIIANGIDFSQPNAWLVTQPGMSANLPPGMPELNNLNAPGDWIRR